MKIPLFSGKAYVRPGPINATQNGTQNAFKDNQTQANKNKGGSSHGLKGQQAIVIFLFDY